MFDSGKYNVRFLLYIIFPAICECRCGFFEWNFVILWTKYPAKGFSAFEIQAFKIAIAG